MKLLASKHHLVCICFNNLLRWLLSANSGENLFLSVYHLQCIWSDGDHSSKIYDLFDMLVKYLGIFCCET